MLEGLIAKYGLVAILIGSGLEGETVAFLGGVSAHRHLLAWWTVACAAAVGSFTADQIFFFLGRRAGHFKRIQTLASRPYAERAKHLFNRHPTAFVLAFRFIYGMRTISPIMIGIAGFPAKRFVLLNAISAVVWGVVISGAGYLFSGLIERLLGKFHLHVHLILALVAAAGICAFLVVWSRRRMSDTVIEEDQLSS